MTAYVIAQISIHDQERYDRYAAGFLPVLAQYGGRVLAVQDGPDVAQGQWDHDRIVILSFDDRAAADRWAGSPEYRKISEDRLASTEGVVLFVNGLG